MRDPYLIEGTLVLKNKLGITNDEELDIVEADYTGVRLKQMIKDPLPGNFDLQHLYQMHQYIFQDIYDWAGQPRAIDLEKPEPALGYLSIEYAPFEDIKDMAISAISKMKSVEWSQLDLDGKASTFSKAMAELWRVHCFREGNTRTVATFCSQYADSVGMPLDQNLFAENSRYFRTSLVAASAIFKDVGDRSNTEYLIKIVKDAMVRGQEKQQRAMEAERSEQSMTMAGWKKEMEEVRSQAEPASGKEPEQSMDEQEKE